ncbi:MAG: hypothetical protein QXY07_03190 [Candidatus Bathyarchaeia archaeon]
MGLKYIMVTHWANHWDKLPNNETHFTRGMLKSGMTIDKVRENIRTIFIKKNEQTRKPEKAWEGSVYGFRVEKDRIYFKVKIDREIPIPSEYIKYPEGWYAEGIEEEIPIETINYPPFFYILNTTNDYNEFEKYTYSLLKLLGLHQIFRYEKQRGQPDGFFKFGNLAVIYDTTLKGDFQEAKETQIKNFAGMLKTGSFKYADRTIDISHCNKQVWIITRGTPRTLEKINGITVKEVPINQLIKVYAERLREMMDDTELENRLNNL